MSTLYKPTASTLVLERDYSEQLWMAHLRLRQRDAVIEIEKFLKAVHERK